jgi:hypothetical protein
MKTMKNPEFYIICWLAPLGAPAPLATVPTQAQRLRWPRWPGQRRLFIVFHGCFIVFKCFLHGFSLFFIVLFHGFFQRT